MPPRMGDYSRLDNLIGYLTVAVTTITELADAFGTPFLNTISSTASSLLTALMNVKRNKEDCVKLMEQTHTILYAIVSLHVQSETGVLPPGTLGHIGKFSETLQRIHVFVQTQCDGSRIQRFFRQNETSSMLRECTAGLQQALEVFKIQNSASVSAGISDMQEHSQKLHMALLEMLATFSDATSSERLSFTNGGLSTSGTSSNSLSLLPPKPKIFHGRDSELTHIVDALSQPVRIAILGGGGIGKTSLAKAVLHHPETTAHYEHRFFVALDSASSSLDMVAIIGSYLGLEPEPDLTKPVIKYFQDISPCLLILDNLESPWEPAESRNNVEEFLSLLTEVPQLALVITMRGMERPAKVRWTRPFLPPLEPLAQEAARQTFIDIADESHGIEDIDKLLSVTANLPLAIDLMANLVNYDSCSAVLSRWEDKKTTLLSDGYDKSSSLSLSIDLSLSSPRIKSCPGATDLLSLLSLLPDGLSDTELLQSQLPIQDVLTCKATLLRISLGYINHKGRFTLLLPIREYIRQFNVASASLVRPLFNHFYKLLDLYMKYRGAELGNLITQISSNLANLHNILHIDSALGDTPVDNPEDLIVEALEHFSHLNDPWLKSKFYNGAGVYYMLSKNDRAKAMEFFEASLPLSKASGNVTAQCFTLIQLAWMNWSSGNYALSQTQAQEIQKLAVLSSNLTDEASALRIEAMSCTSVGNYKQSISLCHRAREIVKLCGLSGGDLDNIVLTSEATAYSLKSEYTAARAIYAETIEQTSASSQRHAFALLNMGLTGVEIGANDVEQTLSKARSLFNSRGYPRGVTHCKIGSAELSLRRGNISAAKKVFTESVNSARGKENDVLTYCLQRLGDITRWDPAYNAWVFPWTVVLLAHGIKFRTKLVIHKALRCLGDFFHTNTDEETAFSLFTLALEGFMAMDVHRSRGECMLRLGDIFKGRGDLERAAEMWREALPLFEKSSQAESAACVNERLATISRPLLNESQTDGARLGRNSNHLLHYDLGDTGSI
ncbi:hypothetical protein FB451DRAFT_1373259 [Mycena latifolia]|nr:hypothetical protein FB451DRAFT_1373259 [Mycena latifolia]